MKALFLAAGLGTRLRPYTNTMAKPQIPFLGLPLFFHAFDFLNQSLLAHPASSSTAFLSPSESSAPLKKIWVNAHHLGAQWIQFLENQQTLLSPTRVQVSDETAELLDSAGAIQKLAPALQTEPEFWVMNADECLFSMESDFSLKPMIKQHQEQQALATLLVTQNPLVGSQYGGLWTQPGSLAVQSISKASVPTLQGWHYVGLMLLSSKVFSFLTPPLQARNILYDILLPALQQGERVQIYPASLTWLETGILDAFQRNEAQLSKIMPTPMLNRLQRYPEFPALVPKLEG